MKNSQRGGSTILGIIIGVVFGLAAALAVAVYVTRVPVPFVNKAQSRTAEQDAAETKKNQNWDPNAPLHGKNPAKPASAPEAAASAAQPATSAKPAAPVATPPAQAAAPAASAPVKPFAKPSADPLGDLAAAKSGTGGADPFLYFVQVGAFRTPEDAESQRAKLSLMGLEAKVTEREQSGRTVYRVRIGPFDKKDEAERQKEKAEGSGIEAALVRVQR